MKPLSAKLLRLLLAGALSGVSVVSWADTLERVRSSHTLTLGYLPGSAPFSALYGDTVEGYAIDLCLKISERVKSELQQPALQVRFQPVEITQAVAAVSSGKVDILCTPTPQTLERRKAVSFSLPVYTAGLSAVVRKQSPEPLLKALNGEVAHDGPTWRATVNRGLAKQTYAVLAGSATQQWVGEQMRLLGVIATLVSVKSNEEGVRRVAEGGADAFFADRILLKTHIASGYPDGSLLLLDRIYEYAPVSLMITRGDDDFRLLVDTVLSEMYRSGEIEQAYVKYLDGVSDTARRLFKVYALP